MVVPRGFLLRWVVAYVVAAGIGGAIVGFSGRLPLAMQLDFATVQTVARVVSIVSAVLAATVLAVVQWQLLREVLLGLSWREWVGASVLAALIARLVSLLVQSYVGSSGGLSGTFVLLLVLTVLTTGGAQYFVLRRHADDPIAWLLAYAAGFLTGTVVLTIVGPWLVTALGIGRSEVPALPAFAAIVVLLPALAAIAPALATGWAIPRLAPR